MHSCEIVGKGACITRMGAVRNCSTNTIMEKNKRRGGVVKDMEFLGVLEIEQVDFPGS